MKAFGWIVKGKRGVDGVGFLGVEGGFPRTKSVLQDCPSHIPLRLPCEQVM